MNVNIFVGMLLAFALLGALDKMLAGRLGVAGEFDRGLTTMGDLAIAMVGIYCLAVTASVWFEQMAGPTQTAIIDRAVLVSIFLAADMGGWAVAKELAASPEIGAFAGVLLASTMGELLCFTIPVSLGALKRYEHMGFMQGVVWGIVSLPVALLIGALVLGMALVSMFCSIIPVLLLCFLLVGGLRLFPQICMKILVLFGGAVRILGILLSCIVTLGLFVPSLALVPLDLAEEVLAIVFKVTAIMCGSMVASRLMLRWCGGGLSRLGKMLGVNEYSILGLTACVVSNVAMLPLYSQMDVRGKMLNAAVCVSGAFVLGGQMAFISSVADARSVFAFFVCKLLGAILAGALALRFTKDTIPLLTRDQEKVTIHTEGM